MRSLFTSMLLLSVLIVWCFTGFAQSRVTGRMLDSTTGQPVPFVSVALYRIADTVAVIGGITDSTGRYLISAPKSGSYQLKTFFVGYKPASTTLLVANSQPLDLGTLLLIPDSRLLNEVRVTGQRAELTVKADRQTYQAAQFRAATGGTAVDVLRNLPGVSVNAEGDVTLRGSNGFLILLNGKPVQANLGTLLSQLPANSIESIDVITTPNARYDPDGKAGILSITIKTGADNGWSAQVNGLAGLPSLGTFGNAQNPQRYGADVTLNYRQKQWDLVLSSAYTRNDIAGRRVSDVSTAIGNRQTRFPSDGERSFDRYTFTNRLAVAYTPTPANVWNAGLYMSRRTEDRIADIVYSNTKTATPTGTILSQLTYFNANLVRKQGQFYTANLDYTHTLLNKATLSAGTLYEYDFLDGFTLNRNLRVNNRRDTLQYTRSTTDRPIQNFRANLDASLPLWGGKLETGYQFRDQQDTGDYSYREQNGNNQPLREVAAFTGRVAISTQIHSGYVQMGGVRKKIEYGVGLRFEHSVRTLQAPQNQTYVLLLNNFFPSMNLAYRVNAGLLWKAGFSRRVQRSSNFALNPLPEREHSETLEQGDPNLLPEFVNLAEIGMTKNLGRSTLLATVYYQRIENIINRVNRVYADTILSRIFTNAGVAERIGLELAADLKLTKKWTLYLGGNLYRYTIAGQLFQNEVIYDRAAWVYSINANSNVQVSSSFSVQANVNYLSQRITAQGDDSRFLTPNLSLRKTWLNNRLSLLMQWQNIGLGGLLPSNEQRITTRGRDFFTTTNYIQEQDMLLINLSYSLRQVSKKAKLPGNEFGEKEF